MLNNIAFLGIPGSYTWIAAGKYFSETELSKPCDSISTCIASVASGKARACVVPLENSLSGSINETYDSLNKSGLSINAEIILHIRHALLSVNSTEDFDAVYSNPQAIVQCRQNLKKMGLRKIIYTPDTATAAKLLASLDSPSAAIASRLCSGLYGLKTIRADFGDNTHNYTRFAVISPKHSDSGNKYSLMFAVTHRPGSLVSVLLPYAHLGLNLTKIESRPVYGKPWEYVFFLDFESEDPRLFSELSRLMKKEVKMMRILGHYQKGEIHET